METPADTMRRFVYGNASLAEWQAQTGSSGEPWASFRRARDLVDAGTPDEAVAVWRQIALDDALEARQRLQAWHFLRGAGQVPPPESAKRVLGTVIEMPVEDAHDLLAAYDDGSARYLNQSGRVLVWEGSSAADVREAIATWIEVGGVIAERIGPWEEPTFPALPPHQLRLMMLTPSGPHFGQGPYAAMSEDEAVRSFTAAAGRVLELIVGHQG